MSDVPPLVTPSMVPPQVVAVTRTGAKVKKTVFYSFHLAPLLSSRS